MELLQRIKTDRLKARKDKDTVRATLLTTLVGEAETALKGKQAAKFDMLSLVKKFMANCHETLSVKYDGTVQAETKILAEYIPRQLTESEIITILEGIGVNNLSQFMGHMSKNYKGQFDGQLAREVFECAMG